MSLLSFDKGKDPYVGLIRLAYIPAWHGLAQIFVTKHLVGLTLIYDYRFKPNQAIIDMEFKAKEINTKNIAFLNQHSVALGWELIRAESQLVRGRKLMICEKIEFIS